MIEIDFEYIEKRKINKDELLAREYRKCFSNSG